MATNTIEVNNLQKKYKIGRRESYLALRDVLADCIRKPFVFLKKKTSIDTAEEFWALKDVSFNVKRGEVIGIIGRNGAGKTTLLKILSRITEPTDGVVTLYGRVVSLLEVGTGFHPELTGRENVYFNGSILGMKKREIDRKFDEIVEFSGVEKFLDMPVKHFSVGMKVRLAFSVAAHLEPEILLVDEVLAVGDFQFQQKCLGKMKDVSSGGRTVLFVSHNMPAVRNLCSRTILIERGKIAMDGNTEKITSAYLDQNLNSGAKVSREDFDGKVEGVIKRDNPTVRFCAVSIFDRYGIYRNNFKSSEEIFIGVDYECITDVNDLRIVVQVVDEENRSILLSQNVDASSESVYYKRKKGSYRSFCRIPANTFGERRFYISVQLVNLKVEHMWLTKILMFDVTFEGYNLHHGEFGESFARPLLDWETKPAENKA